MNEQKDSKTIRTVISELETLLGAEQNFLRSLLETSDWEFVVKLHTLFEAAVTHQVTKELRREELRQFIGRLDMSSDVAGKLVLVKQLKLLASDDRGFIRFLSEMRNYLIHNISAHPFSLTNYLAALSKERKSSFLKYVAVQWSDPVELVGKKIPRDQFLIANSKLAIWMKSLSILLGIYLHPQTIDHGRFAEKLARAMRNRATIK